MNDFTKSLLLSRQLIHFTRVRLMEVRAIENENPIFTPQAQQLNFEAYRHFFQPLLSSPFSYNLSKQTKCKQRPKNIWKILRCPKLDFLTFLRNISDDFTPLENCSLMMLYKRWAAQKSFSKDWNLIRAWLKNDDHMLQILLQNVVASQS